MPWTVEYNAEYDIIQCTYVGRITDDDFKKATIRSRDLAKTNNTSRFLIDDSEWEGGASTLGLHGLPALFEELGFERTSRGALILPPLGTAEAEDAHFFETVCYNRGWQVKVFTDRQDAIDWLTSK